jgi:type II secretory pathway component PulF
MQKFLADCRGIVTGLIVMIVTDLIVAMIWIATMPAVTMIWDIVIPSLPANALVTMNMLNNVMGWFLLAMVIGTLIYGAAWATHRVPVDVMA